MEFFFPLSLLFLWTSIVLLGKTNSLLSQGGLNYGLINHWNQETSEVEKDVVNLLFTDYNKFTRPNERESDVVVVSLELTVAQLVNLDGKSNSMKSSVWPTQRWHDFRLAWNKTGQFRDPILAEREFRLPSSDIWHAEIVLLNTRDGQYKPTYPVNMLINKGGAVTWMPPSIYISGCQVDASNFPYDSQECELVFGSWTYDSTKVIVKCEREKALFDDPNSFYESAEWKINAIPCRESSMPVLGSPHLNYSLVVFTFQVSRKALFYQCWLVTPTLILVMIVIVVFYLPVEAGEKMGLSMFTMMSLPMPLMLCSKFMSSGGQTTPMLVLYTYCGMILSSASVMSSVIVVNVHYRAADTHKMQPWVKKLFVDFLPKYLRMERPSTRADRKKKKLQKFLDRLNLQNNMSKSYVDLSMVTLTPTFMTTSTDMSRHANANAPDSPLLAPRRGISRTPSFNNTSSEKNGSTPSKKKAGKTEKNLPNKNRVHNSQLDHMGISRDLQVAYGCIEYVVHHLRSVDDSQKVSDDWMFVATVLDRMFLLLFTSLLVILTFAVFFKPVMNYYTS